MTFLWDHSGNPTFSDEHRFTQDGVPILPDAEIEDIAYSTRAKFGLDPRVDDTVQAASIPDILSELNRRSWGPEVRIEPLGELQGKKLLGEYRPSSKLLLIDQDLVSNDDLSSLFHFTAAHEIGHWALHSGRPISFKTGEEWPDIKDDRRQITAWDKPRPLSTPRDWVEHHAKVFAASFLMPRRPFKRSVLEAKNEYGALGVGRYGDEHLYLDGQACNINTYKWVVSQLKDSFQTSRAATRIRLKTLGLIIHG